MYNRLEFVYNTVFTRVRYEIRQKPSEVNDR